MVKGNLGGPEPNEGDQTLYWCFCRSILTLRFILNLQKGTECISRMHWITEFLLFIFVLFVRLFVGFFFFLTDHLLLSSGTSKHYLGNSEVIFLTFILYLQSWKQALKTERCCIIRWDPGTPAKQRRLGTWQGQTDTRRMMCRNDRFCFRAVSTLWKPSLFKEAARLLSSSFSQAAPSPLWKLRQLSPLHSWGRSLKIKFIISIQWNTYQ